jgi:hypothetical protein
MPEDKATKYARELVMSELRFQILFEEYRKEVGTVRATQFLLKNKEKMYGTEKTKPKV